MQEIHQYLCWWVSAFFEISREEVEKMKVYISIDMEGISGMVDSSFVTPGDLRYERGTIIMTDEANAVAKAAFDGGATDVHSPDSRMA